MACFWSNQQETTIEIPTISEIDNITYYNIQVTINTVNWWVSHRYNDFYELHNQLIVDHGVSKDILPQKKVIGNKDPLFVEVRRKGLEKYLQNVLCYLKHTMPKTFVEFLDFHLYEVFCLLQSLAFQICKETDSFSSGTKIYTLNPLQLHSITVSHQKPFPGFERPDPRYDISHVMDLCSELTQLNINGISSSYLHSNIIPNDLPFDFSTFKNIKLLKVKELGMENVTSVNHLRNTVETLTVNKSNVNSLSQILQCDVIHKSSLDNTKVWSSVTKLDLSENNITTIDETIKLVPNVETLVLCQNKMSSIADLSCLTKLTNVYMSNNLISQCDQLHTKLGNIKALILSQNNISTLKGFEKLYSLENLDVSFNQISEISGIEPIGELPCLQNLILTGNIVATMVDYRIKVLECFRKNVKYLCLDNERPSQAELDKVQVLIALRIVKEGKIPDLHSPKLLY